MERAVLWAVSIAATLFFFGPEGAISQEAKKRLDKKTIGAWEDVILLPWRVKVPARIDTGARMTSLDARDIVVKGKMVHFRLPERAGGLKLSLPLVKMDLVRTSEGEELRPEVELDLCIRRRRVRALVNLNDRRHMSYAMIVGRNVLAGNFVVDVSVENTLRPKCVQKFGSR